MSYTVRDASPLDLLAIAELGTRYRAESQGFDDAEIDYEHGFQCLLGTLGHPGGILLVAEDEQGICGFMWAVVDRLLPWSSRPIAYDHLLYLTPEARKGSLGISLIRAYYRKAKALGASEVLLSHASGINPERLDKLYRALGFEPVGHQYRRS